LIIGVAVGAAYGSACGSDSKNQPADGGPASNADGGAAADAPDHRVEEGPRTPICENLDPSATAPRFELQIDGVTKTAGETKVATDNNGNIQITVGYPTLTQGSTGSQVFYVRFRPDAGSGPCDDSAFRDPRSAGYS
jgi:hypothetical protein